jgi:hypothetical protein
MQFDHLDEDLTQRLLHGELTELLDAPVRAHLAACTDCRERVAEAEHAESQMLSMLRHLDSPVPQVSAQSIVAAARGTRSTPGRWAAGILLGLGLAGSVYAAPRLLSWLVRSPEITPAPTDSQTGPSGIALAPGPDLLILFDSTQAQGQITVSLSEADEVVVRALGLGAAFDAGETRLRIDNRGSRASFEIEIPRTAARVEIRIAEERVFLKEGMHVTTDTPLRGRYVIPLAR